MIMKTKFFFLLLLTYFLVIPAQEITGSWKGELEIQGAKLPLIVHFSKNDSVYKGTLDSPNQGATGIPMDKVEFNDKKVSFEIKSIGLQYNGTLKDKKVDGTFSQNGFSTNLSFDFYKNKIPTKTVTSLGENIEPQLNKVNNFLDYLEKNNMEAGGISIFKNGKEVLKRTFGQKNLPDYNTENHLFQIGSITKTFTSVMLHQLEKEGKLKLSDKLSTYFPDLPNSEKISLTQLLNHTSGMADYVKKEEDYFWLIHPASEKQIMDNMKSQKLLFEPGISYSYSNSGYYLLTKILEKVSKKSFASNLEQRILKPLKLKNIYSVSHNPNGVYPSFSFENGWNKVEDFDFKNVIGVGDIASEPTDLNIFITALFEGKILDKSTVESMKPAKDQKFGSGIATVPFYNKPFLGHSGGTYGTNSLMIFNAEDNIAISYSLNADRITSNKFITGILSSLYGLEFEYPDFKNKEISADELQKFVGEYVSKDIPLDLKFFVENGILKAQATGQPSFPLDYKGNNEFTFDKINVKVIFNPEKSTLIMEQNGLKYNYTKK